MAVACWAWLVSSGQDVGGAGGGLVGIVSGAGPARGLGFCEELVHDFGAGSDHWS
jgi:hypothetical protein